MIETIMAEELGTQATLTESATPNRSTDADAAYGCTKAEYERRLSCVAEIERRFAPKVRFSIGPCRERYSGVWSALGRNSDFYLGARDLLAEAKISLHGSRVCQFAFLEKHFSKLVSEGLNPRTDRTLVRWKRPPAPEWGAILVLSLLYPADHLALPAPVRGPKNPVLVIGNPTPGRAVQVEFFYSREKMTTLEPTLIQIGRPLFYWNLENGESVSMVVREIDFDRTLLPPPDRIAAADTKLLTNDAFPSVGAELSGLQAIFWNRPEEGEPLQLMEIGGVSMRRNK